MNNIEKIWEEICNQKDHTLDSFLEWFHNSSSNIDLEKECCDYLFAYLSKNNYNGDKTGIIRWSNQAATDTNVFSSVKTMEEILSLSENAFKHLSERMISNSLMNSNNGYNDAFHAYIVYALCKQPYLIKEEQVPNDSHFDKSRIKEVFTNTPESHENEMTLSAQRHISGVIFWPVFILFVFACLLTAFFIADSIGHDINTAKYFAFAGIIFAWGCKDSLRTLMSDFNKENLWTFCAVFLGGIIGTALLCYLYELMDSWGYGGALGWLGALLLSLVLFGIVIIAFMLISKITQKGNMEKEVKKDYDEGQESNDDVVEPESIDEHSNNKETERTTTKASHLHAHLPHIKNTKISIPICAIGLLFCGYLAYTIIKPATIPETVYLDSKHVIHIDRKCNNAKAVYSIDSDELFKTYKGQSMMMCTRCVDNKTAALLDQKLKGGEY